MPSDDPPTARFAEKKVEFFYVTRHADKKDLQNRTAGV
jgi:hypothetical protein